MVQRGGCLGLALKARESLGIATDVIWQELEGNKAVQPGILGFIHHTHSPTADFLKNPVVRERLTDERIGVHHSVAILGFDLYQVNESKQVNPVWTFHLNLCQGAIHHDVNQRAISANTS